MRTDVCRDSPRFQLILFFGLSLLAWLIWIPQAAAALGHDVPAIPLDSPLNALAVWAPGLAALVVCALATGKASVRTLVRPIRYWRVGVGWYAFVVLFPAVQWLTALGIDRLLGRTYTLGPSPVLAVLGPEAAALLPFVVVFAFPNALGEELGWRGFALPKLQARHSALTASIVLGLFWGFWHIPAWIAQEQIPPAPLPILVQTTSTIPAAILFTWVYNNTGGSLLPVWLFHASLAITGSFTPALPTRTATILGWAVAICVVALTGPARLCRRPGCAPEQT